LENIGNYSIQKITKEAVREYGMRVGEWHSPSSISYVLQNLHHRNPLRGTEKIRIYVGQTCLFFDDAYKQMGENTNSLLIIILCMVGLDSPDIQKIEAIKKLMTLRFFNGMLGGIPKKAYYFVGKTD
jgi:cysteine protease ATG4